MSSFTSDQGPISSMSELIMGESYRLHATASTLFCENYWCFGELGHLRRELWEGKRTTRFKQRGSLNQWRKVREHGFRRRLLRSWRVGWLILDCAHRTSTF